MTHAAAPTTTATPLVALPGVDFETFKSAAILVGQAAQDAEDWQDITTHLENAFSHPLYEATDCRQGFAETLAQAISDGIFTALE